MTKMAFLQWFIYILTLLLLVKPLGLYMAKVYENKASGLNFFLDPIERGIYRLCSIRSEEGMDWKNYLAAMLVFNLVGILVIYIIQRIQGYLPLNSQQFLGLAPDLAFNTATSFVTNTNWQANSPETTVSYLTQMLAFTVQNFLSAASGMALLVAFIRGLVRTASHDLGNFWVDAVRSILYILLPLSCILAILLISQGTIQNFKPYQKVKLLQPFSTTQTNVTMQSNDGEERTQRSAAPTLITEQIIAMGPVASQVAIKQLGSNGGGFFNTNAAHPFENPNPLTNFLEMLAILLIPAAFCYTFGLMVNDPRQGLAILIIMLAIFIPLQFCSLYFEQNENPKFQSLGLSIDQKAHPGLSPGGNMEGKETRFGVVSSALWATATTASSNGSVNATLDSFTPLGGMVSLFLMHLGEIVFGGVGSGLYGMLLFVILTVFVAGLMVGRTPEYLGKKIESFEIKMTSFAVLVMPTLVLVQTAVAVLTKMGVEAISNPGTQGFSEILYAFSSMANNNGSAFAGLNANNPFYNLVGGLVMLMGRYWLAIPVLAIAGSLIQKKYVPISAGTLQTHSPLFVILTVSIILILGSLSFFPVLVLGPFVEHLQLWSNYGR